MYLRCGPRWSAASIDSSSRENEEGCGRSGMEENGSPVLIQTPSPRCKCVSDANGGGERKWLAHGLRYFLTSHEPRFGALHLLIRGTVRLLNAGSQVLARIDIIGCSFLRRYLTVANFDNPLPFETYITQWCRAGDWLWYRNKRYSSILINDRVILFEIFNSCFFRFRFLFYKTIYV